MMFSATICLSQMFATLIIVDIYALNTDKSFVTIDANSTDIQKIVIQAFGKSTETDKLLTTESLKHKSKPIYRVEVTKLYYRNCSDSDKDDQWVAIEGDKCRTSEVCEVDATKKGKTFTLSEINCVA
ncbi:uncharacterized protein LOC128955447 [Oppia nitens]|uniref:uncharacterized protein LOC128955447 n=1 Tax=Oppia nitens TaxID=1686743 RepID=UPI0023DA0A78|nr:uncharacterized protein LOC128955447 [Oppia nitens]